MNEKNEPLNAAELANMWTQYMNDTMAYCFLAHLLKHCKDAEVKKILEYARSISKFHIESITRILSDEKYPIPRGFSKEDVYMDAPPLFPDNLILIYLQVMSFHGLSGYALAAGTSIRSDQREHFAKCLKETTDLHDRVVGVLQEKGIISRPPHIPPSQTVDFIKDESYGTGWFGKKRPLNSLEISGLFYNMEKTVLKVMLDVGFGQVAHSKEVREYFMKGAKLCEKQLEIMSSILSKDFLSAPKYWQSEVTNSIVAPFSDKLMLYHVISLVSVAVAYYSAALSVGQRRDLTLAYTRMIADIGLFAEDGVQLMIKNGWLEEPPSVQDREALSKRD
ncbi:DUF3231 family protein [Heyndrickxia acidicola]|uniref:DUF3231 family protein n=1 Tax=Heyndrickxia acidicola TaxID=209389 RepID=A0ABU6MFQ4_9BACI|nr:DUF3231 family protein [Heyndrickxia acidicola]MED1201870.1 DUF3231 family protein [Heyndrickxia acidicola]